MSFRRFVPGNKSRELSCLLTPPEFEDLLGAVSGKGMTIYRASVPKTLSMSEYLRSYGAFVDALFSSNTVPTDVSESVRAVIAGTTALENTEPTIQLSPTRISFDGQKISLGSGFA
jgi:hypothetical protein